MSEVPPVQPPQEPIVSNYPRQSDFGTPTAGMADRCYYGGRAYFRAIYWALFILAAMVGTVISALSEKSIIGIISGIFIIFAGWLFAFYINIMCMLDIAKANGMKQSSAIVLGIVFGFVGIIGVAVIQFMALEKIKKSGMNINMLMGVQKKKLIAFWHQLLAAEGRPPMKFTVWKDPVPL